jgi:hypothetical protein
MLKFYEFINLEEDFLDEAKKKSKKKEFNLNDAKGKLFEILAGSHLHHGTSSSGSPNGFLSHFRDEEGKRPQEVHDYIKSELDTRNPGMYEQINQHAMEAASHMRDQLAQFGHKKIKETAWTSQSGDHHRFTGEHDPASDADVMVKTEKGPIGISMKYGGSKNMNLRNNGLEELERIGGLKPGDLTELRSQHMTRARALGIESHDDYKEKKERGDKSAKAAEDSATQAQKEMAKRMSGGLAAQHARQGNEFLRSYVADRIAPQTTYQHFRIHSRPVGNGVEHHMTDMKDDAEKLKDFEDFRVAPHSGGISFRIEGRRKGSDSFETVLDQAIKKGSGPMKGFASTTKAPFLSRSGPPKAKGTSSRASKKQTPAPVNVEPPTQQQSEPPAQQSSLSKIRVRQAAVKNPSNWTQNQPPKPLREISPIEQHSTSSFGGRSMYSDNEQRHIRGEE